MSLDRHSMMGEITECFVVNCCSICFYNVSPTPDERVFVKNLYVPFGTNLPLDAKVSISFFIEDLLVHCDAVAGYGEFLAISRKSSASLRLAALLVLRDLCLKLKIEGSKMNITSFP